MFVQKKKKKYVNYIKICISHNFILSNNFEIETHLSLFTYGHCQIILSNNDHLELSLPYKKVDFIMENIKCRCQRETLSISQWKSSLYTNYSIYACIVD